MSVLVPKEVYQLFNPDYNNYIKPIIIPSKSTYSSNRIKNSGCWTMCCFIMLCIIIFPMDSLRSKGGTVQVSVMFLLPVTLWVTWALHRVDYQYSTLLCQFGWEMLPPGICISLLVLVSCGFLVDDIVKDFPIALTDFPVHININLRQIYCSLYYIIWSIDRCPFSRIR